MRQYFNAVLATAATLSAVTASGGSGGGVVQAKRHDQGARSTQWAAVTRSTDPVVLVALLYHLLLGDRALCFWIYVRLTVRSTVGKLAGARCANPTVYELVSARHQHNSNRYGDTSEKRRFGSF
jgi:hypothetical protein